MARAEIAAAGLLNVAGDTSTIISARLPHLDLLRGLAAVAVCAGHARAFLFVDYAPGSGGAIDQLFYFLIGRHHQAVMIFFALSGFLVGGSVLRAHRRGSWSWSHYLLQRLGRLWVVVVPALLLTFAWDSAGRALDPAAYSGALWLQLSSGPQTGQPGDLSFGALLGNIFFVQTILTPTFGSNGPLWSLANEFWYYLLFPLGICAWHGGSAAKRATCALAAITLAVALPFWILAYFTIWLGGAVAYGLSDRRLDAGAIRWAGVLGLVGAAAAVAASARWNVWQTDFATGLGTAAALPWLARLEAPGALYRTFARSLSEISYTLYLVHFPWLMFLYIWLLAPTQLPLGPASFALLVGAVTAALLYAAAIWFLFERNTDAVRGFVEARLLRRARSFHAEEAA